MKIMTLYVLVLAPPPAHTLINDGREGVPKRGKKKKDHRSEN